LRAERHAVHHSAFRADARPVASLVHLVADFVSFAFEGAEHFVALPHGAALAGFLHLTSVAAVDRLHRRRAHWVALEKSIFTDASLDAAVFPNFAVLIHFSVMDASVGTYVGAIATAITISAIAVSAGFLGSGPFVTSWISESALIAVIVDADLAASRRAELTGFPVAIDTGFSASGRSGDARSSVDGDSRFAAARSAENAWFAGGDIDSDAGSRSRSASRRAEDAGFSGALVDAGLVAAWSAVDARFAIVGDADFAASGRAEDAELTLIVDSGAVASRRADDANFAVVGDADFPADSVLVDRVDAALPLRATVGRVVTRQRRQLRRFVATARRRRALVLTSRAFGQIRAVTSFRKFTWLHEEPRRRLLHWREAARGLRPRQTLRRPHRSLAGEKPAGHGAPEVASLILSLITGNAAIVRRRVATAAYRAAATAAAGIVISGLSRRPCHLTREEEEEEDSAEGVEEEEGGRASTRHRRRHCLCVFLEKGRKGEQLPSLFLFVFVFVLSGSPAATPRRCYTVWKHDSLSLPLFILIFKPAVSVRTLACLPYPTVTS